MRSEQQSGALLQVEAQASPALAWLSAIVESSNDAIIGKDLDGVITAWNQGAEKIFGYTAHEMVGSSFTWLVPPDRQDEESYILGKIKRGEKVERLETMRQTKDGRLVHLSITALPTIDATGRITGVSNVARDITEQKQGQEALREAQSLYHSLVEQMAAGVFRKDAAGRYVFVNSWFCQLSASKPEHYLGKTPHEMTLALVENGSSTLDIKRAMGLADSADQHHASIMQTGQRIELEEERLLADGSKQYFHVVKAPVFAPDGTIVGTQGILIDITGRKLAEEEIRSQLDELQRWHQAMLGREERILELKSEVNELLAQLHQPARYMIPALP